MRSANLDPEEDLSSIRAVSSQNAMHSRNSNLPGIPDQSISGSGSENSRSEDLNSQYQSEDTGGSDSRSDNLSSRSYPHSPHSPNIHDGYDEEHSYSNSDGDQSSGQEHRIAVHRHVQNETSGEETVENNEAKSESVGEQEDSDEEDLNDDNNGSEIAETPLEAWRKEDPSPVKQSKPEKLKDSKENRPSQKESFKRIFMHVSDDDSNLLQALQDAKRKFSVAREGAMADLFANLFDRLDVDRSGSIEINGELLNSMDRLGQPIVLTDLRIAMEKVIVRKCDRMQKENMFQNRPVWDAMYKEEFVQVMILLLGAHNRS